MAERKIGKLRSEHGLEVLRLDSVEHGAAEEAVLEGLRAPILVNGRHLIGEAALSTCTQQAAEEIDAQRQTVNDKGRIAGAEPTGIACMADVVVDGAENLEREDGRNQHEPERQIEVC